MIYFFHLKSRFFFLEGSSWAPHGPEACPYNQIFKEQNLSFNTWIFIFNIWKLPQPRLSSLNFRFLKKKSLNIQNYFHQIFYSYYDRMHKPWHHVEFISGNELVIHNTLKEITLYFTPYFLYCFFTYL